MLPLRGELPAVRMPQTTVQWLESSSLTRRPQAPTHEPAIHRVGRLGVCWEQERHFGRQGPYVPPNEACRVLR